MKLISRMHCMNSVQHSAYHTNEPEKMLQEKLFHRFLHTILITAQLLGFWPYNSSFDDRPFKPTKFFYIYSISLFTIINVGYFYYFQDLYSFSMMVFKSEGARITIMYGVACISIMTILIYPMQLRNLTSLNGVFVKGKCLIQTLNEAIAMEEVSFAKELVQFATKTFVISALQMYLCIEKLRQEPASMIFGYIIPDLIINLMANSFYGILLIIFVYMKQINQSIRNVTKLVVKLQSSDKKRLEKVETTSRLSDRLNELTIYRYRLCDLTREICAIFSFHTNSWIIHRVCMTLTQLFVMYIMVVIVVFHNVTGHWRTLNITVVQTVLTVVELLFMSKTCNDVNKEVRT